MDRLPVAVDAMGGDNAPASILAGVRIAVEQFKIPVLLVGDPEKIGDFDLAGVEIQPAYEVIEMGADPAGSIRRCKDASILRAAEAVRDRRASSLLSAGNTGAAMAAALLRIGRLKGASRPAIAVPIPSTNGVSHCTLLDCGANAEVQPELLSLFARMGVAYTRHRFAVKNPRVGLLTIGEEAGKGNSVVKEAAELMAQISWQADYGAQYIGNVEGNDLFNDVADVVVCDGFTGNVTLKALEGFHQAIQTSLEGSLSQQRINEVLDRFDSRATGAAVLLGTKQLALISHGSSTPETMANAIHTADSLALDGLVNAIEAVLC